MTYLHFLQNFIHGKQCKKTSAKLSSAVKKKIGINIWLNLEFPYILNTLCTFWSNSILFQGLENRFNNSIFFQYFQYRVETLSSDRGRICHQMDEICHRIQREK